MWQMLLHIYLPGSVLNFIKKLYFCSKINWNYMTNTFYLEAMLCLVEDPREALGTRGHLSV